MDDQTMLRLALIGIIFGLVLLGKGRNGRVRKP